MTKYAEVLLPMNRALADRVFTYEVPEHLREHIVIGDSVLVPFRSSTATGYVIQFSADSSVPTKSLLDKNSKISSIPVHVLTFSRWLSKRYLSSWWEALRGFISTKHHSEESLSEASNVSFKIQLTQEQQQGADIILHALQKGTFHSFLLHGITGSGKTEVYLRCTHEALKLDKTVLVLVPEIALSFQTAKRFQEVFQENVVVLHSGLTEKEKRQEQGKITEGRAKIVIGPRMALFSPLKNLGLIVIDEEHDASYKQESQPRYHAIPVARKLAEESKAVLLLGSATPSLESYYSTTQGKAKLLTLSSRYEASTLPSIHVIDLRQKELRKVLPFSPPLLESLNETLGKKEQAILFLNRRGFSPLVLCTECGHNFKCPQCSITLTFHLAKNLFRCHYCDYKQSVSKTCPRCQSEKLTYKGFGTQRLEEELQKQFPGIKTLRLDRDTTSKRGSAKVIVDAFSNKEAQVLIGTQMVTKGFHFPDVNLVGIIYADHLLHFPDFRASEKTFQTLTQVSGRAGRKGTSGKVILQTYDPEHPAIVAAAQHDYLGFFQQELEARKKAHYPPFASLANVLLSSEEEDVLEGQARKVKEFLQESSLINGVELLGPAPCPIEKINRSFRWHLLLKSRETEPLSTLGQALYDWYHKKGSRKVRLTVDIDPLHLL